MTRIVALAGNPNCGKTTLFNRLTGASQRVGNWPGVTIDKKEGKLKGVPDTEVVDLPGIYSLSPYSPEENVSRDFLLDSRPDVVLNIVDATNLERNLFLTAQILDMQYPTVIALNMMDAVEKLGDKIDVDELSKRLGCAVVPISALKGRGIDDLIKAIQDAKDPATPMKLDDRIEQAVTKAQDLIGDKVDHAKRFYAVKLIENDERVNGQLPGAKEGLTGEITSLENEMDDEIDAIIADARYNAIGEVASAAVEKAPRESKDTVSDKVDRIITHRILGLPIFIVIIGALFLAIIGFQDFTGIGTYLTDLLNGYIEETVQPAVEDWCVNNDVSDPLTGLLVDGIVGGVGSVIGFLPQMACLFLALCILEDIGYMARIAFVMDRIFRFFGLSGKSFIPVIVGTGCGVPGILASRTIESPRDRRITAMTVTFMPCGAKLPVIAMIAGALFNNNGLIALYAYLLGIAAVLVSGIILKKFRGLSGKPAPFIMELPPYHIPEWFNVLKGVFDRSWAFVKRAGTLILLSAIIIWFFGNYNSSFEYLGGIEGSMLESLGEAIFGLFQPLGWGDNWELTVASITGLVAKENMISTLGILFGEEVGDDGEEIWGILGAILTPAAGLAFLTFNLLCAPCFAAIGAMHRELGTWKATGAAVLYQTLLAYFVAAIVYVLVSLIDGTSVDWAGYVMAGIGVVLLGYFLAMKDPLFFLRKKEEASE
ncbi:MAG: ferrous iron transport protein B [Candidatus Methanomethylophilaceae archaeon]|nr:ferrous iron transport protein B [Candidatus Methanomethylophilaceae archaeon]